MKRAVVLIFAVLLLVFLVSSCSSGSCPAYSVNNQQIDEINS